MASFTRFTGSALFSLCVVTVVSVLSTVLLFIICDVPTQMIDDLGPSLETETNDVIETEITINITTASSSISPSISPPVSPIHAITAQIDSNNDIYMLWHNNLDNMTHDNYCDFMHKSLFYTANCWWSTSVPQQYSLLITATPRSGTVFTAKLLNSIGLKMVNDWHSPKRNDSGQISWIDAFYEEDESKHVGPSRLKGARFKYVLHQIREPLASMTSMCTEPLDINGFLGRFKSNRTYGVGLPADQYIEKNYQFINKHVNYAMNKNQTQVERIMTFYYNWHMNLNKFGFPIFKVENLFNNQTVVDTLNFIIKQSKLENMVNNTDLLNGKINDNLYNTLHTKANKRGHRKKFTWDELFLVNEDLALKIWNLSQQYGYEYDWVYNHSFGNDSKHNYNVTCFY